MQVPKYIFGSLRFLLILCWQKTQGNMMNPWWDMIQMLHIWISPSLSLSLPPAPSIHVPFVGRCVAHRKLYGLLTYILVIKKNPQKNSLWSIWVVTPMGHLRWPIFPVLMGPRAAETEARFPASLADLVGNTAWCVAEDFWSTTVIPEDTYSIYMIY